MHHAPQFLLWVEFCYSMFPGVVRIFVGKDMQSAKIYINRLRGFPNKDDNLGNGGSLCNGFLHTCSKLMKG